VAPDLDLIGVANVGVVPGEAAAHAVVGPLDEGTEIVSDPAAGEQAHLLQREIVVGCEMRCRAARLIGLSVGEGRLQHDRKRRPLPVATLQGVAAELEAASKRGQLEKGGVAGGTGLPGLARVERQSLGMPLRQRVQQHRRRHDASDGNDASHRSAGAAAGEPAPPQRTTYHPGLFLRQRQCRNSGRLPTTIRLLPVYSTIAGQSRRSPVSLPRRR
jgi:hypothetical protein